MIPSITDTLINEVIQTDNMVRAGQTYWRQGRVIDLDIAPAMDLISARVRGNAAQPYDVTIIFG
jgi:uncharacterized Zn finger protein